MIILMWDDVVIDDYVNMSWWLMMLLLLLMSLRWDDVEVDNDVDDVKKALWWCYVVYVHGGAVSLLDIPSGGNRVVKEF